jgi:hypothetical protein
VVVKKSRDAIKSQKKEAERDGGIWSINKAVSAYIYILGY